MPRYSFESAGVHDLYGVAPQQLIDNPRLLRAWRHPEDHEWITVWAWDIASGREVLSERCKEIHGLVGSEHADVQEHHLQLDQRTHPEDRAQMAADREAHFAGSVPLYVNEHRVRHTDGQWRSVLSRGLVISRDSAGRPMRMIGTHTDITERKQAEAMRAQRDRAEAAQRAMTPFLSRVSHELRTPLNASSASASCCRPTPRRSSDTSPGWPRCWPAAATCRRWSATR